MEDQIFSTSDVPETTQESKKNDIIEIKTVFIDANEFRNMKSNLSFVDGFMFGLGFIIAVIVVITLIFALELYSLKLFFNDLATNLLL